MRSRRRAAVRDLFRSGAHGRKTNGVASWRVCGKTTLKKRNTKCLAGFPLNVAQWTQGGGLDEGLSPAWRDDRGGSLGRRVAESPQMCRLVGALSGGCERFRLKGRSLWAALLLIIS
jgi:hypothetical protein